MNLEQLLDEQDALEIELDQLRRKEHDIINRLNHVQDLIVLDYPEFARNQEEETHD